MQLKPAPIMGREGGDDGQWLDGRVRSGEDRKFEFSPGKTMNMAIIRLVDSRMQKGDCELTGTKCDQGKI